MMAQRIIGTYVWDWNE